ncbi:MAG: glycosyltransferase family 1 protein [Bacillota bacterium]|nr:glycosyltransferase family 1 protein [Bacillota bacterium]
MSEPIRVLHIFGALNPGGVETLVMNIYRCIDREKVQFDFALTEGKKSFFDDEVLSLGGRIFYFDKSKNMQQNLTEIFETKGPFKVMHSHVYFYSGLVLRNAKKHGVPVRIAHAHNTSFGQIYTLKRRAYEWLMRKLILQNATDMLGCSTDACEFVFGEGCMDDPRCSVMCNGFDVSAFEYSKEKGDRIREMYGLEGKTVIGHVGRFEDQKNHTQLVEQFAAIHKKDGNTALLMVGRGSLMDSIKEKCKKLGIYDACVFAGAQKDTPSYYSAMDVFLFPSLYEGLGSVLIEAQANGLHVVTSKTVVPDDIDVTGNAAFVPLEAPADEWADAVLAAAERITDNLPNKKVKETYDIKTVTDGLCKIYFRD